MIQDEIRTPYLYKGISSYIFFGTLSAVRFEPIISHKLLKPLTTRSILMASYILDTSNVRLVTKWKIKKYESNKKKYQTNKK